MIYNLFMDDLRKKKGYKKLFQKITASVLKANSFCDFLGKDIVVGVSGGIDSLSLFTFLKDYYELRKFKGRVYGVNVVLGKGDVKPVKFDGVINLFPDFEPDADFNCSLCARNRKMEIFKFCEEKGVKFVALGHIANDFAENFLWNVMYHKRLESMPVCRNYFNGKFFVVRPFAFVFKNDVKAFARFHGLKDMENKCELKNVVRDNVRDFLKQNETKEVSVYRNLMDVIEKNNFWGE